MENAVIENMMTRASVRKFTSQAVEDEKVETLLKAAMAAPTAVNSQPWHFVVITDKSKLDQISQYNAPLSIVVRRPEQFRADGTRMVDHRLFHGLRQYSLGGEFPGTGRHLDGAVSAAAVHGPCKRGSGTSRQSDSAEPDQYRIYRGKSSAEGQMGHE